MRLEPFPFETLEEFNLLPATVKRALRALSAPCLKSDLYGGGQAWCTLAMDGDKPVAAHLYVAAGRTIYAWSTWVHHAHRGEGLGTKLWEHAIEMNGPSRIKVTVVSNGGWLMMHKIKARHAGKLQVSISDSRDGVERSRLLIHGVTVWERNK